MKAYPSSMLMPRAFSSGRRSVSTPVRAWTSVLLPWSMCPAVPTIMASLLQRRAQRAELHAQRARVLQAAQVEQQPVLGEAFRAQVQAQGRLQRGQRQLADTQRPLHREAADAFDRRAPPDDQAGLRTAQQLVAAEADDVAAGRQLLLRQRLARQAVR